MPQISLFKNVAQPSNPDNIDLMQYLDDTRDGRWEDIVMQVRVEPDKEKRSLLKQKMPTATLSGLFSYRSNAKILEHSGVLNIDLDDLEDLNVMKERLISDPSVFCVFLSTSGRGLRVLFRILPKEHTRSFYGISEYISINYGVICDTGSIAPSQPFVVSCDPELSINDKAPIWTRYPKETVVKKDIVFIHTPTDFQEVFTNIIQRNINICESHADYLKVGQAISSQFGEEGRDYFHKLAQCSSKYKFIKVDKQYDYLLKSKGDGVSISSFYWLAKANGVNIVSEKTKLIIKTTVNGRKAGLRQEGILKNLKDNHGILDAEEVVRKTYEDDTIKLDSADDNIVDQFEMYVSSNYNLRMNEITGYFEEGRVRKTERDINTIFKEAKKKIVKLDKGLMMNILKSDFVPTYNPFFDLIESDGNKVELPPLSDPENNSRYKTPLIDKLASCIKNGDELYTKYFLRKWIVGVVSSMHRSKSPLFLALVGPQGTGKTHFLRNLLPKELLDYFVQTTKTKKGKDFEFEICENIIIFDDEMVLVKLMSVIDFNALVDQQWFSLRRPYGTHNEKSLAYAVWCGTSNYYDVVKDPISNRRIIPIEVLDIDKELFNSINKLDLFKEAYKMYKDGFDWRIISQEDKKFLNQDLVKYETTVFERDLLEKYFEPSHDAATAIRLTTTDIKIELEKYTKQNLSMKTLGNELNKKDAEGNPKYIQKSTRDGLQSSKKWLVNRINRYEELPPSFLT